MPDHTLNPRGEFDSLINEARAFFAEAANRPIKAQTAAVDRRSTLQSGRAESAATRNVQELMSSCIAIHSHDRPLSDLLHFSPTRAAFTRPLRRIQRGHPTWT